MESKITAGGGETRGWRDEEKRKKLMDVDNNVVVAGRK